MRSSPSRHRRTKAGLESARRHLRAVLGHQVRLKFTPELEFREDEGLNQVERVAQLLREAARPIQGEGSWASEPPEADDGA